MHHRKVRLVAVLGRVTHWKQGCNGNWSHAFLLIVYNNIKIAGQWGSLLYLMGVISFPRLSDGVFSKI